MARRLSGWQWLFVAEGLPSIVLGVIVLFYLDDQPEQARWLTPREKNWLIERLKKERAEKEGGSRHTLGQALASGRVWLFSVLYFTMVVGACAISIWLPQIVKAFGGLSNLQVGFISAIPFLAAAVAMVLVGRSSDARGEGRWHAAGSALAGTVGLLLSAWLSAPDARLAALTLACAGLWAMFPPFWTMPAVFLSGTAAAAGIAVVNSVGNLGGFVGPYVMGFVRQTTGSFSGGLLAMAAMLLAAGLLPLWAGALARLKQN